MAYLAAVSVSIELFDNGSWRTLEEFEIEDTLKEIANTVTRYTSAIQIRPALFRFQVVVAESFTWGNANALKLVLTLDEGVTLNQYETLALRPGGDDVDQLAADLQLEKNVIMHTTRSGASRYYLDSIWMPLEHTGPDRWIRAEFEFEKLYTDRDLKLLSQNDLSIIEHGRIRIDVVPCQISQNRGRSRILSPCERQPAQFRNLVVGTCFHWDPETTVDEKYYYRMQPIIDHQTYSFVFFYNEVGRSRAIPPEMIDYSEVDREFRKTFGKGSKIPPPLRFNTQSPHATTSIPSLRRTATSTTQEEKSYLQVTNQAASSPLSKPDLQARNNAPWVDDSENVFGRILDPNLMNGRVTVHHAQAISKRTPISENDIDENVENQPQLPLLASLLQQMRRDLTALENTQRLIRVAKADALSHIKVMKAQNVQEIEQMDRDIEETAKLLLSLRERKHELLNDQKSLNIQETKLNVDVNSDEELAVASKAVRRYQAQQLRLLRDIQLNVSNKRRRSQLSPSPEDSDTIVVSSPAPR